MLGQLQVPGSSRAVESAVLEGLLDAAAALVHGKRQKM